MAEAKSEYLAVNKLKASNKDVSNLMFGSKQVRLAWMNGKRVWDIWSTVLSAVNFNISSSGGNVKDNTTIYSYGTDAIGENYDLEYTINPNAIGATTSSDATTHTVTINQTVTGKSVQITATQTGRVALSTSYGTPTVTSTTIGIISAGGGTVWLTVNWSQTKTITYDNGTKSSSTVTGSSTAAITNGKVNVTGASINQGGIYIGSAGTYQYDADRIVYTINSYSFSANNISKSVSNDTIYVYQQANVVTGTTWHGTFNIAISHGPEGNVPSAGGTKTIYASCTENGTTYYTSGSGVATTRDESAIVRTDIGTFDIYTNTTYFYITGYGTGTLTIPENLGNARTISVYANITNNTQYTYITQDPVYYVFTADTKNISVSYSTTSVTLTGTSSRNGFYQEIQKGNVDVSSGTLGTITYSGTTFSIPITFGANELTTAKTITVTVTQPLSFNKITYTITQAGKPAPTNFVEWDGSVKGTIEPSLAGRFSCKARLVFDNSVNNKEVYFEVLRGSSVVHSENITVSGTYYNSSSMYMDVEVIARTQDNGETFYLRATYGSDTATIQLNSL